MRGYFPKVTKAPPGHPSGMTAKGGINPIREHVDYTNEKHFFRWRQDWIFPGAADGGAGVKTADRRRRQGKQTQVQRGAGPRRPPFGRRQTEERRGVLKERQVATRPQSGPGATA